MSRWPVRAVLATGAVGVAVAVSLVLADPVTGTMTLWLGTGIQVAALCLLPTSRRVGCAVWFCALNAAVLLAFGLDTDVAVFVSLLNLVQVLIAVAVVGGAADWIDGTDDGPGAWLRFALGAVVLAPAAGAVLGTATAAATGAVPMRWADLSAMAGMWFLTVALPIGVLTPMVLRLQPAIIRRCVAPGDRTKLATLVAALTAVCVVLLLQPHVLLLFLVPVPLIVLLFRHGIVGVVTGLAVVATVTVTVTHLGLGPFHGLSAGSEAGAELWSQAFLVLLTLLALAVTSLLQQRQTLTGSDDEDRRLIGSTPHELAFVADLRGRLSYVSAAGTASLGLRPGDLIGDGWQERLHGDDAERWAVAVRRASSGDADSRCSVRVRRSDGPWRWYAVRMGSHRSPGQAADRIIGVAHDVTASVTRQHLLERTNAELERAATTDPLTGLPNRRYLTGARQEAWRRARQTSQPLSMLIVDIDHFKSYNDHYGHTRGDGCLVTVAHTIAAVLKRPTDVAARYGGEEFVVVLPDTGADGARTVAQDICDAVREQRLPHPRAGTGVVTVSVGVATTTTSGGFDDSLFDRADTALYEAKRRGRDQVGTTAGDVHDPPTLPTVARTPETEATGH